MIAQNGTIDQTIAIIETIQTKKAMPLAPPTLLISGLIWLPADV